MKTKNLLLMMMFILLIIGIVGCEGYNNGDNNPPAELFKIWKLIEISDNDTTVFVETNSECDSSLSIAFYEDNTISGKTSVNSFSASFILQGKNLSFSNILTTKIAEMGVGQLFFDLIESTASYELSDSILTLFDNEGSFLKFKSFNCTVDTTNLSPCDKPDALRLPEKDLNNYEVTLYKDVAFNGTKMLSYLNDSIAILTDGQVTSYIICNFDEYAANWNIPAEGIKVTFSGEAYQYDGILPLDVRFVYYLKLTSLVVDTPKVTNSCNYPDSIRFSEKDLNNYQVILYKNKDIVYNGINMLILYTSPVEEVILYDGETTYYSICNLKDYADGWNIPEEGLNVILNGEAFRHIGFQPLDVRFLYYLKLTSLTTIVR